MKTFVATTLVLALFCCNSVMAQFAPTDAMIVIDTVEAAPGTSVGVPIRLAGSSLAFCGVQIPVESTSPTVVIDSVSFAGSIKPPSVVGVGEVSSDHSSAMISFYPSFTPPPFASVSQSQGLLATAYVHVLPSATPGTVAFDTVSDLSALPVWRGVGFSDAEGLLLYLPSQVRAGAVKVLSATDVGDSDPALPAEFALAQNYPNPFNPTTTIEFSLPTAGPARLDVYNVLGQRVITLVDGRLEAGLHRMNLDASSIPSGVYFYRLSHASGSLSRKMILLR